jgi:hypothetical protein
MLSREASAIVIDVLCKAGHGVEAGAKQAEATRNGERNRGKS